MSSDSEASNEYRQQLQSRPDPSTIRAETMAAAEEITRKEVLFRIHPTFDDYEKRADVILFLQTIIMQSFEGIQVFPYGSVPLKTYLWDGDIDLTVICKPDMKEFLAHGVYALLKNIEEQNVNAECTITGAKMIRAQVKLVSCTVENIKVDISFNQLGGVSAVCFLEKVDGLVNKNHLFKQSALLIKAWCHYESRILGGYHGLLATYALECLILVIIQLFGSSLNGPLEVLYRFLDYYGKFDWDNYSISLNGPVRTSSVHDLVVTNRGNGGAEVLLSGEDLGIYTNLFGASTYNVEPDMRLFSVMHLNIIDPLRANNNLGRSVYIANAIRIKAAFNYGARNLGRILQLPGEYISDEIKQFFECTLMWNRGRSPVLETLSPLSLSEIDFEIKSVEGDTDDDGDDGNDGNDDGNDDNGDDDEDDDDYDLGNDHDNDDDDVQGDWPARDVRNSLTARPVIECMDMNAVETSHLIDLTGDYTSLVRSLAHGWCTLGYSATIPPPTVSLFQRMLYNSDQRNMNENYAVGGQFVYAENSRSRGTGAFIPNLNYSSFREVFSSPRLVNLMRRPFGGSRRNRDNDIETGPSQNDNTNGNDDAEGRTPESSINLNSEYDFPPLN